MKKLLLLLLLVSPFAFSYSEKITVIDYDGDTKITVYCIGGYVFTQYDKTALVQLMMRVDVPNTAVRPKPMMCSYYSQLKSN